MSCVSLEAVPWLCGKPRRRNGEGCSQRCSPGPRHVRLRRWTRAPPGSLAGCSVPLPALLPWHGCPRACCGPRLPDTERGSVQPGAELMGAGGTNPPGRAQRGRCRRLCWGGQTETSCAPSKQKSSHGFSAGWGGLWQIRFPSGCVGAGFPLACDDQTPLRCPGSGPVCLPPKKCCLFLLTKLLNKVKREGLGKRRQCSWTQKNPNDPEKVQKMATPRYFLVAVFGVGQTLKTKESTWLVGLGRKAAGACSQSDSVWSLHRAPEVGGQDPSPKAGAAGGSGGVAWVAGEGTSRGEPGACLDPCGPERGRCAAQLCLQCICGWVTPHTVILIALPVILLTYQAGIISWKSALVLRGSKSTLRVTKHSMQISPGLGQPRCMAVLSPPFPLLSSACYF